MVAHRVINDINLADSKAADFKAAGIKADLIAESTAGSGTTFSTEVSFDAPVTFSSALVQASTSVFTGTVQMTSIATLSGTTSISGPLSLNAAVIGGRHEGFLSLSSSFTLSVFNSGQLILMSGVDKVLTLPSTAAGMTFTIAIAAAGLSAGTGLSVSPAAADAIMGGGLTSTDNKDLILAGATDAEGDCVTLVGDGIDGWYITAIVGTWSKE